MVKAFINAMAIALDTQASIAHRCARFVESVEEPLVHIAVELKKLNSDVTALQADMELAIQGEFHVEEVGVHQEDEYLRYPYEDW